MPLIPAWDRINSVNSLRLDDFYLLGYNASQSTESQLTYQTNMLPPSSALNNKPSKKPA
jgi:hypothetical protein